MSEVIFFLRSESEKQEKLLEELLSLDQSYQGQIDRVKLVGLLQNTYKLYSAVEQLRHSYSEWVRVHSNRIYDSMKALIALDSLPEPWNNLSLPTCAEKGTIAGYLYVFHLFQVHAHGIYHLLNSQANIDGSVSRVFGYAQEDLSIRREFFDKVRAELDLDHSADLATGVNLAYADIQALLVKKSLS
ncbi:MAG: hypothetical protein WBG42_04850 [Cryomorphaceae bacterium]